MPIIENNSNVTFTQDTTVDRVGHDCIVNCKGAKLIVKGNVGKDSYLIADTLTINGHVNSGVTLEANVTVQGKISRGVMVKGNLIATVSHRKMKLISITGTLTEPVKTTPHPLHLYGEEALDGSQHTLVNHNREYDDRVMVRFTYDLNYFKCEPVPLVKVVSTKHGQRIEHDVNRMHVVIEFVGDEVDTKILGGIFHIDNVPLDTFLKPHISYHSEIKKFFKEKYKLDDNDKLLSHLDTSPKAVILREIKSYQRRNLHIQANKNASFWTWVLPALHHHGSAGFNRATLIYNTWSVMSERDVVKRVVEYLDTTNLPFSSTGRGHPNSLKTYLHCALLRCPEAIDLMSDSQTKSTAMQPIKPS